MMLDERVSRILTEMTEDLKPKPDPYGRVVGRYRRRRRRQRVAAVGLAAVAMLSVAGVVVNGGGSGGTPDDVAVSGSDRNWPNARSWSTRLAQSPPTGAVARDAGYVEALSQRILQAQRSGEIGPNKPVAEVKVLFVDDVGPHRIALAALALTNPEPNFWTHASVWLVAERGASADKLATPAAVRGGGDGVGPYESVTVDDDPGSEDAVHVAIAPHGCAFDSAAWPAVREWKPETTGSYLVRTSEAARPEWWRVTCDGAVRAMVPAPGSLVDQRITDAQLAQAVAKARGTVDPDQLRDAVTATTQHWGYAVTALPSVLWDGPITGTVPMADGTSLDGRATVQVAPAAGGGWVGEVRLTYAETHMPSGSQGSTVSFTMEVDPTAPSTVVAVALGHDTATTSLLVLPPAGAARVTAVRDGQDIASADVRDAAALLTVPAEDGLAVHVLDAGGKVMATGEVAPHGGPPVPVDRWHED